MSVQDISPFECPICCEFYDENNHIPTTFQCGHSCCLVHLRDMTNCPICRAKLPLKCSPNIALRDGAVAFNTMLKKTQSMSVATASVVKDASVPVVEPTASAPAPAAASTATGAQGNKKNKKKKKKAKKSQHQAVAATALHADSSDDSENEDEEDAKIRRMIDETPFLQSIKDTLTQSAVERNQLHTATISLPCMSNKVISGVSKASAKDANKAVPPPQYESGHIRSSEDLLGPKETWVNSSTMSFFNHRRFLTFSEVPTLGEFPVSFFNSNFKRKFKWVFYAEVIECSSACSPAARHRIRVRDLNDEECYIAFYPEEGSFDFTRIRRNQVICLINPEKKVFLDGTEGIRVEDLRTVFMISMTLEQLMNFDELHHRFIADQKCFKCRAAPGINRCSRCKAAGYCSRECQMSHWTAFHKYQCKAIAEYLEVTGAAGK